MNLRTALTFGSAAFQSVRYLLTYRIRFPQHRLGDVLETSDSKTYIVYRETILEPAIEKPSADGVVLVFQMRVSNRLAGEKSRIALFNPLANVATPFFAGMPGFRRKLWLSGDQRGEFLELYEWATVEDANRFVTVLQSLLAPFDFAGSASYHVVEYDSVDEYVDAHPISWLDQIEPDVGRARRFRLITIGLVVIAVFIVGYVTWNHHTEEG